MFDIQATIAISSVSSALVIGLYSVLGRWPGFIGSMAGLIGLHLLNYYI